MSRDITPFPVRIPAQFKARLEQAAKAYGRSMNAEILARLEATLDIDDYFSSIQQSDQNHSNAVNWLTALQYDVAAMESDLDEARQEINQLNIAAHARELQDHLSYSTAMLEKIDSRIEYLIDQTKSRKG